MDVLPTVCTFIALMCENQDRKKQNGYSRLKTEPNQTKFEKSKLTSVVTVSETDTET